MDSPNRDAVDELLQTYGATGGINYLDAAATLPSRLAIEAACAELMSLMFPGFRSEALVSSEDLADTTRTRIRNLHARLKTEICRSLGKIPPNEAIEAKADEVLTAFLRDLPSVRRLLWTDIDAAYEGDPAARSYDLTGFNDFGRRNRDRCKIDNWWQCFPGPKRAPGLARVLRRETIANCAETKTQTSYDA